MKQVLVQGGDVIVRDVPAPQVDNKNILVRVEYSCISVGTEMTSVRMSGLPLYRRALKQPENVKRALAMVEDQGIKRTWKRISGMLAAGVPTGYSAAGTVIETGSEVIGFSEGDRVACAGAGVANHAEFIDVPVNLAVKIPEGLGADQASTVTLGAIAMQGVRRASPTLGETTVVVGLGILGQITVQLLRTSGCRVIGVDIDTQRVALAEQAGMGVGMDPTKDDYVQQVIRHTDGFGADAVIITASGESDKIVSEAMQACRKKGRVVVVGDVGLKLNRHDFYKKELDFFISTSYGPGRYDPAYEEGGRDYPLPYVRWTENRNMEAYLRLLAEGKVNLQNLSGKRYPVDRAVEAYGALKSDGDKPLMVLLEYPERSTVLQRKVAMRAPQTRLGTIRVGIAGAGGFAQGMHLPNLVKLRKHFSIHGIMSRTGANARAVATQYEATYATTDYEELLSDSDIDLIMITTRHDLHGRMIMAGLEAGKHVFVEKPLALTEDELGAIEDFYARKPDGPVLMTGFNRRFSPAISRAKELMKDRSSPLMANYRMNAGYIPPEHWVHGPQGGGRNIGEACHIYDVFACLTDSPVERVSAHAIQAAQQHWQRNDNFVATLNHADGSVCTLTYTALGDKSHPKERMEIFVDGKVISLNDYRELTVEGSRQQGWSSRIQHKGQLEEMEALAHCLIDAAKWPISLETQLGVTRTSFQVEKALGCAVGS
ncbi:MAG: bi-domain-containing oxidoreductase [Gammaproteobacteria bacterium]